VVVTNVVGSAIRRVEGRSEHSKDRTEPEPREVMGVEEFMEQ
jgi:hypothetical protein